MVSLAWAQFEVRAWSPPGPLVSPQLVALAWSEQVLPAWPQFAARVSLLLERLASLQFVVRVSLHLALLACLLAVPPVCLCPPVQASHCWELRDSPAPTMRAPRPESKSLVRELSLNA